MWHCAKDFARVVSFNLCSNPCGGDDYSHFTERDRGLGDYRNITQLVIDRPTVKTQVDLILKPMLIPLRVILGVTDEGCCAFWEIPVKAEVPVMSHAADNQTSIEQVQESST